MKEIKQEPDKIGAAASKSGHPERRQYQPPALLRLGSLQQLTQGTGFNAPDAIAGNVS